MESPAPPDIKDPRATTDHSVSLACRENNVLSEVYLHITGASASLSTDI